MKVAAVLGILGCAVACTCATAFAQTTPDISAMEQTAQKRHTEWESLAKDLGERMARILPCDPRYAAGIIEVSRASEARLAAVADYLRAISAKAFGETAAARILLDAEEKRLLEAGLERSDSAQEQTAVDIQTDALTESVKKREPLENPRQVLEQIAAMIRQRVAAADERAGNTNEAVKLLRDLVAKFDARDAALRDESVAFEAERARWNTYYTARLGRAQTECSITQASTRAAPAKQKGKQ
jgi:hypothetical protein